MTSRERVACAIAHGPPDRTPMRYNGRTEVDTRLAEHLGIPLEGPWHETLMRRLGIDVRNFHPAADIPDAVKERERPLAQAASVSEVERLWPSGLDTGYRDFEGLQDRLREREDEDNVPWVGVSTGSIFTQTTKHLGVAETLIGIADESAVVIAVLERMERFLHEMVDGILRSLGDRVDMIYVGDDIGTQMSTFLSPSMIEKHLMPRYARLARRIHAGGARFFFHCCGAIHHIVPMFLAAGVDILNPIQPCHPNMTPETLQRDFGGRVTFCGGIDMQQLLPFGTREEVETEVRRYILALGRRGGYILDSANILHTDIPPENIEAMFRAARETPIP